MKWKTEKLNKIADIFGGYAFKSQYFCDDGNYKVIRIGDIYNGGINIDSCKKIDNNSFKISPTFTAKKGDVLMALSGATTGKTGIITNNEEGYLVNQRIAIIRGKSDENKKYIKYIFTNSVIRELLKSAGGVAQPNLSPKMLNSLEIPVPPLPAQKRIADILDKADSLRKKRQQTMEQCDEFLKSIFLDMFGDPVTNPKGWEIITIRDLVSEVKYGTSSKAGTTGEYPILRMGNITYSGNLDFSDLKYINIPEKDRKKYLVFHGDILFNRTNSKELVGKTAVYKQSEPMAYAGYLIRVRPNSENNSEFISAYLNSNYMKSYLQSKCKNIVGMANINAQELQNFPIFNVPLQLQQKFASIVEKTEAVKQKMQQQLKELDDNFNSLMQRAFKGEL